MRGDEEDVFLWIIFIGDDVVVVVVVVFVVAIG